MSTLLNGWTFMRWIRLVLGILFLIEAIQQHDTLSGIFAAFLFFQVATNTGCCGVSGCAVTPTQNSNSETTDITYEEIKKA